MKLRGEMMCETREILEGRELGKMELKYITCI